MTLRTAFALLTLLLTPACANHTATSSAPLTTLYSRVLLDSATQKPLTLAEMTEQLTEADVIFIGEFHSHQGSHLLQLELLQTLAERGAPLVLSLEQFSRDAQPIVDEYLNGGIGEETLIDKGNAWDNYKGSYRPLLEFAREHRIPVVAANAAAMHVRCVGRHGEAILDRKPATEADWSIRLPTFDSPAYKEKFFATMGRSGERHGLASDEQRARMDNSYAAQRLRDTTMAASIEAAHQQYPNAIIIHLNGAFHSDGHLGTAAALKQRHPALKIRVISPLMVEGDGTQTPATEAFTAGDFLYLMKPLPQRYASDEEEREAIHALIKARKGESCAWEQ